MNIIIIMSDSITAPSENNENIVTPVITNDCNTVQVQNFDKLIKLIEKHQSYFNMKSFGTLKVEEDLFNENYDCGEYDCKTHLPIDPDADIHLCGTSGCIGGFIDIFGAMNDGRARRTRDNNRFRHIFLGVTRKQADNLFYPSPFWMEYKDALNITPSKEEFFFSFCELSHKGMVLDDIHINAVLTALRNLRDGIWTLPDSSNPAFD